MREWDIKINRGILTGYNEAFIVDRATRDKLVASSPKSAEIIRPILRGRDIQKYEENWIGTFLICTMPSLKINIEDYPSVKEHLLSFGFDRLKQTGDSGSRKKSNNKWYETQDSISYYSDFKKPKIVFPNMTKFLPFYYDLSGEYYTNQKCFIITGNNIAYLTAFLNSSLFKFCFKENFPELQGGTRELSKVFFDKIPVLEITIEQNRIFERKIIEIQNLKNSKKNTLILEKELDELIFDLYNLTSEERLRIGFIAI